MQDLQGSNGAIAVYQAGILTKVEQIILNKDSLADKQTALLQIAADDGPKLSLNRHGLFNAQQPANSLIQEAISVCGRTTALI